MEAVGIDCFALAAALGWDIYPIGQLGDRRAGPGRRL